MTQIPGDWEQDALEAIRSAVERLERALSITRYFPEKKACQDVAGYLRLVRKNLVATHDSLATRAGITPFYTEEE